MKISKCLAEKIQEEVKDANAYIDLAMEWKEAEPEAADMFYQLSTEEIGHADKLHGVAVSLIKKYREKNGEPPQGMLMLWDYLHEKHMQDAMAVKVKQGMYLA